MSALPLFNQSLFYCWFILIIWTFSGLIGHDPWKPDEGYTFGLVLTILQDNQWLVPTLAGEPFLEKPPLFFWTAAVFAKIFENVFSLHDAARLTCAFYLGLTFIALQRTASLLFGKDTRIIVLLLFIAMIGTFIRTHQLITDVALLAATAWILWGGALINQFAIKAGVISGLGFIAAFLSKGLLIPGVAIIAAIILLCFEEWRTRQYFIYLLTAFCLIALVAPIWPYLLWQKNPDYFHTWFVINNFGRFFGFVDLGPKSSSFLFYPKTLLWYAFPASLSFFFFKKEDLQGQAKFLVVFVGALLSVLIASHDARELYLLPIAPALALLAVPGYLRFTSYPRLESWFSAGFRLIFAILIIFVFVLSYALAYHYNSLTFIQRYLAQPHLPLSSWFYLISLSIAMLLVIFWIRIPRNALLQWSGGLSVSFGLIMVLLLPYIDASKSYRQTMIELSKNIPSSYKCIASFNLGEPQRALFPYFTGLNQIRLETHPNATSCDVLIVQNKQWMSDGYKLVWSGNRPCDTNERIIVYKKTEF